MEEQFLKFGNLGLSALTIVLLFKFMANHVEHNTKAMNGLTAALHKLIGYLEGKNEK